MTINALVQSYEILPHARSDETGATVIHFWAANNILNKIKQAKKENVNLNICDFYGNTPLHYAVSTCSYEAAIFLIEMSRENPVVNYQGISPAHIAAAKGDVKMLALMAQSPKLLQLLTPNGWGILHYAAYFGQLEAVKYILQEVPEQMNKVAYFSENSDSLEIAKIMKYSSALDIAKANHHDSVVELLLSKNALPTLHASVYTNNKQAVYQLIMSKDKRIDINEPSKYRNFTPLHFAAVAGNFSICSFLVQNGASTSMTDSYGFSAIEIASVLGSTTTLEVLAILSDKKQRTLAIDLAAVMKRENHVLALMEYEFDENVLASNGDPVVIRLIKAGLFNIALIAAKKITNIAATDANGATALHYAAAVSSKELLEYLVQKTPAGVVDKYGRTPLTYAILANKEENVSILTQHENGLNTNDVFGLNPCTYATVCEFPKQINQNLINYSTARFDVDVKGFVEFSLEKEYVCVLPDGNNLTSKKKTIEFSSVVLTLAQRSASTKTAKLFASLGDGKIRKCTIIHLMIIFECRSGIINNFLKNMPALVNAQDGDGITPIMLAAKLQRSNIVKTFAIVKIDNPDYRLDLSIKDNNEMTFFHYVSSLIVLESIKLSGKDVIIMQTSKSNDGKLPLHCAAAAKDPKLVKYMLRQFADCANELTQTDSKGLTPIDYAYQYNDKETADVLISFGATNRLTEAAVKNDIELVKFLLDTGLPINSMDSNSMTALHYAAMNGFVEIEKLLIERGADTSIPASNGYLPLHFAAKRNDKEMCCLYIFTNNPLGKIAYENQPFTLTTDPELSNILFRLWKRTIFIQRIGNYLELNKQIPKLSLEAAKQFQNLPENTSGIKVVDRLKPIFGTIEFVSNIINKMINGEKRIDYTRPLTCLFNPLLTINIEEYMESIKQIYQQIISISRKTKNTNFCHGEFFSTATYPFTWMQALLHLIQRFRFYYVDLIDSQTKLEKMIVNLETMISKCKEQFSDMLKDVNKCVMQLQKVNYSGVQTEFFISVCATAKFVHCQPYPSIIFNPELSNLLTEFFGNPAAITRSIPFSRNEKIWIKVIDEYLFINSVKSKSCFMCPLCLMNIRFLGNNSGITFNSPVGSFVVALNQNDVLSQILVNELFFRKNADSLIGLSHQNKAKDKLFMCFVGLYTGACKFVELRNMLIYAGDEKSCYDICLQQVKEEYSVSPQMFTVIAKEFKPDESQFIVID